MWMPTAAHPMERYITTTSPVQVTQIPLRNVMLLNCHPVTVAPLDSPVTSQVIDCMNVLIFAV